MDTPGVPEKQTLERVVCAALAEAHPARAEAVQSWLEADPDPPKPANAKHFRYAYLSKWFLHGGRGPGSFWKQLWKDESVVTSLQARLQACGARAAVDALLAD